MLWLGWLAIAHVTGIYRCGSVWCCPSCAPVVRSRRAEEVDQGLRTHLDSGGWAEFLTFTVPHQLVHALGPRLDLMATALGQVLSGAPWLRRRDALGYVGSIRAIEVTWGEVNGWHPHVHVLVLFDREPTAAARADLSEWLFGRWVAVCARRALGTPSRAHGIDMRPVRSAGDLGAYLTKVEGGWTAGMELARSDVKRSAGSTPWDLLQSFAVDGDADAGRLFQHYAAAVKGRRFMVWSRGLRDRLGVGVDQADEVLAASEGADVFRLRAEVWNPSWNRLARSGEDAMLKVDFEQVGQALLLLAQLNGHEPEVVQ